MSDLASTIYSAVLGAKGKLGSLVIPATLKTTGVASYNAASGVKSTATTDKSIDVVVDKFAFNEIDGEQVKSSDVKLVMFNNDDTVPSLSDKVVMNGVTYDLINVNPVQAGSKVIIFMLQLRR